MRLSIVRKPDSKTFRLGECEDNRCTDNRIKNRPWILACSIADLTRLMIIPVSLLKRAIARRTRLVCKRVIIILLFISNHAASVISRPKSRPCKCLYPPNESLGEIEARCYRHKTPTPDLREHHHPVGNNAQSEWNDKTPLLQPSLCERSLVLGSRWSWRHITMGGPNFIHPFFLAISLSYAAFLLATSPSAIQRLAFTSWMTLRTCFASMTGALMPTRIQGTVESILFARAISNAPALHGLR